MTKRSEAEYTQMLTELPKLFSTPPLTEETFWDGKNENATSYRLARNIGNITMKAVGVTLNELQNIPLSAAAFTAKADEKLWKGVSYVADKVNESGIENTFWTAGPRAKARIGQGIDRAANFIGESNIGDTLKNTAISAAQASGSVAPLATVEAWSAISKSGEKIKSGTTKVTSALGKVAIGQAIRGKINAESVKNKAASKSAQSKNKAEMYADTAIKKAERAESIWNQPLPYSPKARREYRKLAEEYRRKATQAYESGRQEDMNKYLKQARLYQEYYKKG